MSKKDKIEYPVSRPHGQTKPGTKPNKSGTRLVCVDNVSLSPLDADIEVRRVPVSVAKVLVEIDGWQYTTKRHWRMHTGKYNIDGGVESVQQ